MVLKRQRSFPGHGVGRVRSFSWWQGRSDSLRGDEVSGVIESPERKLTL